MSQRTSSQLLFSELEKSTMCFEASYIFSVLEKESHDSGESFGWLLRLDCTDNYVGFVKRRHSESVRTAHENMQRALKRLNTRTI